MDSVGQRMSLAKETITDKLNNLARKKSKLIKLDYFLGVVINVRLPFFRIVQVIEDCDRVLVC
jgi:hypothetical protein